jgi:hypothetical protein
LGSEWAGWLVAGCSDVPETHQADIGPFWVPLRKSNQWLRRPSSVRGRLAVDSLAYGPTMVGIENGPAALA